MTIGILLVLAFGPAWSMDTEPELSDPNQQRMYERLTHEVRCLVCQNQTIADSTAPLAGDLRREIRGMVEEGRTEEQIRTFLLDRYGDFVLYRPRFNMATALLWLAPVLLLLLGATALWRILQHRAALPVPADEDDPPQPGPDKSLR
jgi:cytochrome c-type biogenesis protein CcmH